MRKLLMLLALSLTTLSHAQISKVEKKISAVVDVNNSSAIKLLEEVVNINSGSMNFEGVYEVGQIFKARLDALGFETRWVDGNHLEEQDIWWDIILVKGRGRHFC